MILVIKQVNLEGFGVFSFFLREKDIKLNIVSMEDKQALPPLEKCKGIIALGAQLLAKVLGAKVKRAEKEEIGWYKINLLEKAKKDPLLKGLENELMVFQWHQDSFDLPKKSVLLASSKACRNQAFRFGENSWGLQFHPEMNKKQIVSWLHGYQSDLNKNKIVDQYFHYQDKYLDQSRKICDNFMELVTKEIKVKIKNK